jgi:hypothetical protein
MALQGRRDKKLGKVSRAPEALFCLDVLGHRVKDKDLIIETLRGYIKLS